METGTEVTRGEGQPSKRQRDGCQHQAVGQAEESCGACSREVGRQRLCVQTDLGLHPSPTTHQLCDPAVPPRGCSLIPETRIATVPAPREQMHERHSAQDPGGQRTAINVSE